MKRISIFTFLVGAMTVGLLFGGTKDKIGLGLNVNAPKLYGDTRSGALGLGGGNLLLRYRLKPDLFLESELGFLRLSTTANGASLNTDMINFGVKAGHTFLTSQIYQPFLYFGLGALNFSENSGRFWDGYAALGAGTEFFASDFLAVNVTVDFRYTSGDGFDGGLDGWRTDGFFNLGLGFIYHFGRHGSLQEPFLTEDLPKPEPFYVEIDESNDEEESDGIVESTDQEMNLQTLQSLMEKDQAHGMEESAMTWEDDILPETDRTEEAVSYTVQPHDWLSKIAEIFYGEPLAYSKIADDNSDVIQNPDKIYAGQKLWVTVPVGMPVFYTVKEGESLSKIAKRFFGDAMKFKDIFFANQDAIEDPEVIKSGQVLKIFLTEN